MRVRLHVHLIALIAAAPSATTIPSTAPATVPSLLSPTTVLLLLVALVRRRDSALIAIVIVLLLVTVAIRIVVIVRIRIALLALLIARVLASLISSSAPTATTTLLVAVLLSLVAVLPASLALLILVLSCIGVGIQVKALRIDWISKEIALGKLLLVIALLKSRGVRLKSTKSIGNRNAGRVRWRVLRLVMLVWLIVLLTAAMLLLVVATLISALLLVITLILISLLRLMVRLTRLRLLSSVRGRVVHLHLNLHLAQVHMRGWVLRAAVLPGVAIGILVLALAIAISSILLRVFALSVLALSLALLALLLIARLRAQLLKNRRGGRIALAIFLLFLLSLVELHFSGRQVLGRSHQILQEGLVVSILLKRLFGIDACWGTLARDLLVEGILNGSLVLTASTINKDETLEEIKEWDDVLARIEIQERFGWYFFRRF